MKCFVILVAFFFASCFGQQTTFSYGQEVEGQFILGYDFSTTETTETFEPHQVVLWFNGTEGTQITQIHGNVYPSWTFTERPPVIRNSVRFTVGNNNATFMWADMYVFGFPPNP